MKTITMKGQTNHDFIPKKYSSAVSFSVEFTGDMNIRNDQDIVKLARQLNAEIERSNRGRG